MIATVFLILFVCAAPVGFAWAEPILGWLSWRGPQQHGVSEETHLPAKWKVGGKNHLWTYKLAGRGTPVIAGNRLYTLGYRGEGPDLQELIVCLDATTGQLLWEHGFNDFLSDIIYNRYSIGSPAVDPETGNVYILTSPGILACFTADGTLVWQHSMMEEFGRLTFPNGRTGCPVVDGDLVIVRGITSNWGKQGPGRDRFYAFEKLRGKPVWASTPGVRPQDSSYSTPVLAWYQGRRVFYCGTGCGNIVCVNARTGEPLWRFQFSKGGVNASVLLHPDNMVIAIHDKENLDTSETGRIAAIRIPEKLEQGASEKPMVLGKTAEIWRNSLNAFSSSPVLVKDRVYLVTDSGFLSCVDAQTGEILWQHRLGPDQIHASPLYADGKLYVPMANGKFFIVRSTRKGAKILSEEQLEGICLGAPAVWNGRVYVHTTKKLYCFGSKPARKSKTAREPSQPQPAPGPVLRLQPVPGEVLIQPGDTVSFTLRGLDEHGHLVKEFKGSEAHWKKYIPAGAKVKSELDADFDEKGRLVASAKAKLSAGAFEATIGKTKGTIRGRLLPSLPYREGFEKFTPTVPHAQEPGVKFAWPPLPWIGARFKWEIRSLDSQKVLAKTLDRVLFQRAITFIGHPRLKNYTIQADVMSEGNRRTMSVAGVINQRYIIALVGNAQLLEVSSNHDRVKASVPFSWQPKVWYRLKARVDVDSDGSGIIRAKAWRRGKEEPQAWTIEVPHQRAHTQGAPGLFGFSPQNQQRVYIDNIVVTPNDN